MIHTVFDEPTRRAVQGPLHHIHDVGAGCGPGRSSAREAQALLPFKG